MAEVKTEKKSAVDIVSKITEKIQGAENVLVALSNNPDVDELAAAIGLTLIIDKMGKHATAIFSGAVPNALEFLQPEKTFETNTNSLQDFIIALNKEKADHLRYKIDGEYVKVFITPYKTTIDEGDLEFSHGDYNVDLVISLNVDSVDELDGALAEHGKILHDATAIDITREAPGKFGEIEWSQPEASSVSEMIEVLAGRLGRDDLVDKAVATALLTGIVAATNRFSNERTTPAAMAIAGRLMAAGADQQLIAAHISVEGVAAAGTGVKAAVPAAEGDASTLKVSRGEAELEKIVEQPKAAVPGPLMEELKQASEEVAPEVAVEEGPKDYAKIMEEELAQPLPYEMEQVPEESSVPEVKEEAEPVSVPEVPTPSGPTENVEEPEAQDDIMDIKPPEGAGSFGAKAPEASSNPAEAVAPEVPSGPEVNNVPEMDYGQGEEGSEMAAPKGPEAYVVEKPETVIQPLHPIIQTSEGARVDLPTMPEMAPMAIGSAGISAPTEGNVLPPPPPPPVPDVVMPNVAPVAADNAVATGGEGQLPTVAPIQPAAPVVQPPAPYLGPQPAMQDKVYTPQQNDPAAFKIPGM
jgi:hypothetical protein